MNNISQYVDDKCTGCNACSAVCVAGAIKDKNDKNGFWYPFVDLNKCVNCGICVNTCPVYSEPKTRFDIPVAYAAWNNDESIRINSSSGGVFSAIAEEVIDSGGIVYGAAYNNNYAVEHIRVTTKDGIKRIMGSKYVQSYIDESLFSQIAKDSISKRVLFSGTSCQTAAVLNYLELNVKEEWKDNLVTVDVLCHGVPSPNAWKEYLSEIKIKHSKEIKFVNMRDKTHGWHHFDVKIVFDDDSEYLESFHKGIWGPSYFTNLFLRECCYDCRFKKKTRMADITLGDFWGAARQDELRKYDDRDKGTSVVLVNSAKGNNIIQTLKNCHLEQIEYDILLKGLYVLYRSSRRNVFRDIAFRKLDRIPYSEIVNSYAKPSITNRIRRKCIEMFCKKGRSKGD